MRYRTRSTAPRTIVVKYAGPCACCGAPISVGQMADYYPDRKQIGHIGALDGNSARCSAVLADKNANAYAGDGLDARMEDMGAEVCGR